MVQTDVCPLVLHDRRIILEVLIRNDDGVHPTEWTDFIEMSIDLDAIYRVFPQTIGRNVAIQANELEGFPGNECHYTYYIYKHQDGGPKDPLKPHLLFPL